jgi:hypothetical protein
MGDASKVERNEFEELIGDFEFDLTEEMEVGDDSISEDEGEVEEGAVEDSDGDGESDGDSSVSDLEADDSDDDSSNASGSDEEDPEKLEDETPEDGSENGYEEKSELELLKEQNKKLLEQLNLHISDPVQENSENEDDKADLLNGVDTEELLEDPEAFKKFLNDYAEQVRSDALKKSEAAITTQVQAQLNVNRMVESFYQDNPQLAGVKKYVGALAREISSEEPEAPYEEVLQKTAEKAYKNLGIAKRAINVDSKKPSFPKAGGKSSRAVKKDVRSEKEKQIDAIINLDI